MPPERRRSALDATIAPGRVRGHPPVAERHRGACGCVALIKDDPDNYHNSDYKCLYEKYRHYDKEGITEGREVISVKVPQFGPIERSTVNGRVNPSCFLA